MTTLQVYYGSPAFPAFILGFFFILLNCTIINLTTKEKYLASGCGLTSIWKQSYCKLGTSDIKVDGINNEISTSWKTVPPKNMIVEGQGKKRIQKKKIKNKQE